MTETDLLNAISLVVREVGVWAVFAWLYLSERQAHEQTRKTLYETLREMSKRPPALPTPDATA